MYSGSHTQETINLENEISTSEEVKFEIDTKYEKMGNFGDNLPGQVVSQDNSIDMESESDTDPSSAEFDIDFFRKKTITQNANTSLQKSQSSNRRNMQKHIKFLGVEFETATLLERNKDPILFLKSYYIVCIFSDFSFFIVFVVGLNFAIVPLLLIIIIIALLSILEIFLCQTPVKNGVDFKPKIIVIVLVIATIYLALFVYSFLVQFPFNSVPLFILLNYILLLPGCLCGIISITPNFTPNDDPNYQLKFFVVRIMAALFDSIGLLDALSDVVLGIELIQKSSLKFLVFGILLFILCNIDYLQVVRRILMVDKISAIEQLCTVIFEGIVLVLTTIVLMDSSKVSEDEGNEDFFYVTVISISTTIVNFLHNLLFLYFKIFSKQTGSFYDRIFTIAS